MANAEQADGGYGRGCRGVLVRRGAVEYEDLEWRRHYSGVEGAIGTWMLERVSPKQVSYRLLAVKSNGTLDLLFADIHRGIV